MTWHRWDRTHLRGILLVVQDVFVGIAMTRNKNKELKRWKSVLELEYNASKWGEDWRVANTMYGTVKQRKRIAFEAHRRAILSQGQVVLHLARFGTLYKIINNESNYRAVDFHALIRPEMTQAQDQDE